MNDTDARLWQSLAPHQSRSARDAARALERGGLAAGQGRVQEGPRAEESDPAGGLVQLAVVARRPAKKREPEQPATTRVLPMQLQVGDRLVDETGEWEVEARCTHHQAVRTPALECGRSAGPMSPRYGPGARTSASA